MLSPHQSPTPDDAAPGLNPYFGGKPLHNGTMNILFADGHVQAAKAFERATMTNRYEGVGYDYSSPVP